MQRRDWLGILMVAASLLALLAYRDMFIEPRAWGAACAASPAPTACVPRAALLWLQHFYLWGAAALALGLWAFIGAPFAIAVAGVTMGAAAVVNFNASWGMWGLAFAAWAWIRFSAGPAAAATVPEPPG